MPIFTSDLTSRGIIYADTIVTNSNENLTLNPSGTGVVSVPATISSTGDVKLASDTKKLFLGAGEDLQIYHDGSDSYIDDSGTGDLQIRSSFARIVDISNSHTTATFASSGVNLRHSNSVKLTTTASGATVTGTLTATALAGETGTLTNTTLDDSLLLTTTEDSNTAGPVITLKRNSSSPADADYLGQLKFKGENDADQEVVYAKITGKIQDASDGTEDGIIEFANRKAGSNNITARLRSDSLQLLNGTGLTVNGTTSLTGALSLASDVTVNGTTFTDRIMSTGSNNNIQLTPNGTGLVDIDGDLAVNLIKSNDSTNIRVEDNLVPATDDTYSLGTPDRRWSALYVTGQTIFLDTTKLQVDGSGDFTVKDSSNNLKKVKASEVEIGSGANKIRIKRRSNGRVQFTDENDQETPVLQIVGDDSTGVSLNSNETIKISGGVGIQTAVSGDTLTITGSTGGFTNSTLTQFPFNEDSSPTDFSDDEPEGVGTASSGTDAFGVAISTTFDCMEPVGSIMAEDFGASESHVGA